MSKKTKYQCDRSECSKARQHRFAQVPIYQAPGQPDPRQRTVEVNLTDRSSFNYPLLIGAKALREFGAAVNPARRYTADKPDC